MKALGRVRGEAGGESRGMESSGCGDEWERRVEGWEQRTSARSRVLRGAESSGCVARCWGAEQSVRAKEGNGALGEGRAGC